MFIFGTKSHKHENRLRALEDLFKRVVVTSICALAACRDGSMDIALVVLENSVRTGGTSVSACAQIKKEPLNV